MEPNKTSILRRLVVALVVACAATAALASGASAAGDLPAQWDPATVAVNHDPENAFLLRPGQILAGPGDAADVGRVLQGWRQLDSRPFGVTLFVNPAPPSADPAKDILAQLDRIRRATAKRPQGPAKVAPNYVFVGESADPINFHGEPRIQGGPGSSARVAPLPGALPRRTTDTADGRGVKIAVLDTGMFNHAFLGSVLRAPGSDDAWDADGDGYADAESGHGTFIAGLLLQVAPGATVYEAKVLNSHGVGDDFGVARAMAELPAGVNIVNLSLGGYTDRDQPPIAMTEALRVFHDARKAVVSAAGNASAERPFWPAAFDSVVGVGAVENHAGAWSAAGYSNRGAWVDAVARGSNLQSTYGAGKTRIWSGSLLIRRDPVVAFNGWASWDGTSFATPITAAMIARTMTRAGVPYATEAQDRLLSAAPTAKLAEFPRAVLLDELEGALDPTETT